MDHYCSKFFSCLKVMIFLTILSAILLSMLMILHSTLKYEIKLLIWGNHFVGLLHLDIYFDMLDKQQK